MHAFSVTFFALPPGRKKEQQEREHRHPPGGSGRRSSSLLLFFPIGPAAEPATRSANTPPAGFSRRRTETRGPDRPGLRSQTQEAEPRTRSDARQAPGTLSPAPIRHPEKLRPVPDQLRQRCGREPEDRKTAGSDRPRRRCAMAAALILMTKAAAGMPWRRPVPARSGSRTKPETDQTAQSRKQTTKTPKPKRNPARDRPALDLLPSRTGDTIRRPASTRRAQPRPDQPGRGNLPHL